MVGGIVVQHKMLRDTGMLQHIKNILKNQSNVPEEDKAVAGHIAQQHVVARQPIFDTRHCIWGYELLFRWPTDLLLNPVDGTVATSSIIVDGYEIVRHGLRDGEQVLINFDGALLEAQIPKLLPPEICIAEILEEVQPTESILMAVQELKEAGYHFAVDDYTGQSHLTPFLPFADIVKVDVLALPQKDLADLTQTLRKYRTVLLAEKVEDRQMAHFCHTLGFSLFQGFFFSRPELIHGRKVPVSHAVRMHIISLCLKEDVDFGSLSNAVRHDPIISTRLLKFVNSAYLGLPKKVNTIDHALRMLGSMTFLQWLCVNVLAALGSKHSSRDMAFLASQRAKFLESLAKCLQIRRKLPADMSTHIFFLAGLFSLLESLMGMPLAVILEGVPIDEDVIAALTGGETRYTPWLRLMDLYEHGDWDACIPVSQSLGLSETDLVAAYAEAVTWSAEIFAFTS